MGELKEKMELMSKADTRRVLRRMAVEILERNGGVDNLVILGIQTKGVYIARELTRMIEEMEEAPVPIGTLDITFYRDDLTVLAEHPVVKGTDIPFSVQDKKIVLVDDVLYSGRTIRAAIDEIFDMGRPAKVELAILVDRGHRELPIRADYIGRDIPTSGKEYIDAQIEEDGTVGRVILGIKTG